MIRNNGNSQDIFLFLMVVSHYMALDTNAAFD